MKPIHVGKRQITWFALAKATSLALLASGFLSGCSTKAIDWAGGGSAISGSVLPLTPTPVALSLGLSRAVAASSVCPSATAGLYKVGSDGKRLNPALLTVPVAADGSYKFEGVKAKGVEVESRKLKASYVVDVTGCGSVFTRLLTGTKAQDIGWGSTLFSYVLNTPSAPQALASSPVRLETLYKGLNGYSSFTAAYAALVTDTPLRMEFEEATGAAPEALEDAAPNAVSVVVPERLREGELAPISISARQWYTNYNYAFEWRLDGQLISTSATPSFTPSGNSQGPHELSVRWGQAAGGLGLDASKPFQEKSFRLVIENTILPQPPVLNVLTPSVNTPAVTLSINSGAGLANCDSFTSLAITEDLPVAPMNPGAYSYSCTQEPTQPLTFLLQNGIGTRTLYLWAMDAAGNISASPRVVSVDYSLVVPVVAITSPAGAGLPFQSNVTIAGNCEDNSGDVSLSGPITPSPALTDCSGGSFSRSVLLNGADGAKTITASQTNQFGNTGSASLVVNKDSTPPTVEIASLAAPSTNAASFAVTVTFSEAVSGFDLSKINLTNASATAFTGSGASYSFTLSPATEGAVSVNIAAGAAADGAGNLSLAAPSFTRHFDSTAPVGTLSTLASNPTRQASFAVSLSFSEAVSNFTAAGLEATNATISALSGSGSAYSFQLHPTGQGRVSVRLRAGAAQDAAGNAAPASALLSRTFDSVGPALTLNSAATNPTNVSPIAVSAEFSESVTGFSAAHISVTNGAVGNFSGSGANYSFEISPLGNGAVTVSVAGGAGEDAAGNGSLAATLSRTFNNARPTVSLSSTRPAHTNLSPFPMTVTFGTSVTGFDETKISATNATLSAFSGSGAVYTFQATPVADGPVTLGVGANQAQDAAGNQNLASNPLTIHYDTQVPTLSITAPSSGAYVNLANQTAFLVTGTCSEAGRNVALNVGSVSALVPCSSGNFSASLDLSSLASGSLTLAASLTDAAGNTETAPAVSLVKDLSVPMVSLSGQPSGASNAATLAITAGGAGVTSYRYKIGSAASLDCAVATGYSAATPVGTGISNSLAGYSDGALKICALGRNAAGNEQSLASATAVTWVKDTVVSPFAGLALSSGSIGSNATPGVTGTSEANATLQLYQVAACDGTAVGTATANGSGTFTIVPGASLGSDGAYALSVRASDPAGNSLCSSALSYTLDTAAPSLTISSSAPPQTNSSPIPVSLTFNETVTGLSVSGFTVVNATLANLAGSGATYTFNLIPTGQGAVTAAVRAGAAVDAAGNASLASLTLSRQYDTVAPALAITGPAEGTAFRTSTVTLTGTCEAGLAIELEGSGLSSPNFATCTAGGTFSVAITPTNGDGPKSITLKQTDAAGNTTPRTRGLVKDTEAPPLLFTSAGVQTQYTRNNSVTFTGSCETTFPVQISGTETDSVSCVGAAWSYATRPRDTDGSRAYTFTQTDGAGNSRSITGTWVRDTVLPVVTLTSPAANFAAYDRLTLMGTCESGVSVNFTGAGLLSSVNNIACPSGSFSQLVFLSPGDGAKLVTVSQTDLAGNTGSTQRTFQRDTTPPALTQTLRDSPYHTNTDTAQFGGACENGLAIEVSGADSGTTTCSSGAWSYTVASRNTDSSRSYTFKQVDAAGNSAQTTVAWVRDTVRPAFTFTSPTNFTTSGNSVSFAGACETGLGVVVSGAQSATVPCSAGTWSFATSKDTDSTYAYTFTQTDLAGNASNLAGSWVRSTAGPTLTITQSTPQLTNSGSLVISGKCSGGTAGSNGVIEITGAVTQNISCPSTTSALADWSYTATQAVDGTYNYTFTLRDNFPTPRTTAASLSWQRDMTQPVIDGGSFTINGGQNTSTPISYNPVSFSAADNLTGVTKFCLKSGSAVPVAADTCWATVASAGALPGNSVALNNYSYNIGIVPQAYSIYLWVMDGAGNISTNAAALGTDLSTITLSPLAPPSVSGVLVSKTDVMEGAPGERIIPAGSDMYIRWAAGGSSLLPNPVRVLFTSDDKTWTQMATGLANGNNGCDSATGAGSASAAATGCFKTSSPSSAYIRVKVEVANTLGGISYATSLPINVTMVQIIAGRTDDGVDASASSSPFVGRSSFSPDYIDAQSFVVTREGIVYQRDPTLGIVKIDPRDNIKKLFLKQTGASTGDGGAIANASATRIAKLALDFAKPKQRLWIYDSDRIRRVDLASEIITTVVGPGADNSDTVANPRNATASISSDPASAARQAFYAAPNGDFYFQASGDVNGRATAFRMKYLEAATNSVKSRRLGNITTTGDLAANDYMQCVTRSPITQLFDESGAVLERILLLYVSADNIGCPAVGFNSYFTSLDENGNSLSAHPARLGTVDRANLGAMIQGLDRNIYMFSKRSLGAGYDLGVWKYNPAPAKSWTRIIGGNRNGFCADGTMATDCPSNIDDLFVTENGSIYILDNGLIRTLGANGTLQSVMGQKIVAEAGTDILSARLGVDIRNFLQGINGRITYTSGYDNSIYEFERNTNVFKVAGNGAAAAPALNVDANSTATSVSYDGMAGSSFGLDPTTGDIYSVMGGIRVLKLQRDDASLGSPGRWNIWNGTGTIAPMAAGADGSSNIGYWANCNLNHDSANFHGPACNWAPQVIGYLNDRVLVVQSNLSKRISDNATVLRNSMLKLYRQTDKVQENLVSKAGIILDRNSLCPKNTPLDDCFLVDGWSWQTLKPDFDSITGTYFIARPGHTRISLVTPGSLMDFINTSEPVSSFAVRRTGTNVSIYYCGGNSKRIRKYNLSTKTEALLDWPIPSLQCSQGAMNWDYTNNSLVFLFKQNGYMGFADFYDP